MKKISLLLIAAFAALNVFSQTDNKIKKQDTSLVAVNMEQMLEKIGFDNLLKTMLESKKSGDKEDAAEIRKAAAAIYGAGIDFKRKALFYTISSMPDKDNVTPYQFPSMSLSFVIPVANRQVIEDNWMKFSGKKKDNEEKPFIKNGNISYKISGQSLIILTDKEMVTMMIPLDMSYVTNFNDKSYLGKIIRRDTIATDIVEDEKVIIEEKREPKKLKPTIEIDKLVNGKILRVYKPKPEPKAIPKKNEITFNPPVIVEEEKVSKKQPVKKGREQEKKIKHVITEIKKEEIKKAGKKEKIEAVPVEGVKEEVIEEAKIEMPEENLEKEKKMQDTLTYENYISPGKKEIIYYVPWTAEEMEANSKKEKEEEKLKKEKFAMNFMSNLNNWLPYNSSHPDYIAALTSKDDIVMYSNSAFPKSGISSYFFGISSGISMLNKGMKASPIPQTENSSFFTTVNFEKGKMVADMRAGCCGTYNEFISKLYFPVTNFWPKEFTSNSIGRIRLNMNMPEMMTYYSNLLPEEAKKEMADAGFSLTDMADMFTGEISAALFEPSATDKGKKEPKFAAGLRIKDAAKAVAFMNKMASQEIKMASSYRFDANGEYLLFSTDKNFFTRPQVPSAAAAPVAANKGEIILDFGKFIKSITKESKLKKPGTKAAIDFFGKLIMVNNSSEDGRFSSTMTFEMGDKEKNVLKSLLELIQKMDKKEKTVSPPLPDLPKQ